MATAVARVSIDATGAKRGAGEYEREIDRMRGGTRRLDGALDQQQRRLDTATRGWQKFGGVLKGLALGAVAAAVFNLGASTVQASIGVDRIENSLRAATGSAIAAGVEFDFVRAESYRLGLNLETSASQYAALTAASKGTELQGALTREIFSAISEASTVMGLSADQAGGALTAIQQIISKGTVSAEELRGQLGERLPGAFQIAARAMGVTTSELGRMLQRGEVMAEDLLPALAREMRATFGAGLDSAINSTQAQFNRLETAVFEVKAAVGDELAPAIGDIAVELSKLAQSDDFRAFARDIGTTGAFVIRALGGVSEAVGGIGLSWRTARAFTANAVGAILKLLSDMLAGALDLLAEFADAGDRIFGTSYGDQLREDAEAVRGSLGQLGLNLKEVAIDQLDLQIKADRAAAALEAEADALGGGGGGLNSQLKDHKEFLKEVLKVRQDYREEVEESIANLQTEIALTRLLQQMGPVDLTIGPAGGPDDPVFTIPEAEPIGIEIKPELTAVDDATAEYESMTLDMDEIWRGFLEGTQDAFVDTFESMLHGQVDSWKDLWDTVVDLAIRAAAEAAAAWATQQFAVNFTDGATGGGLSWGSILRGAGSLFGGGSQSALATGVYGPTQTGGNIAAGGAGYGGAMASVGIAFAAFFTAMELNEASHRHGYGTLGAFEVSGGERYRGGFRGQIGSGANEVFDAIEEVLDSIEELTRGVVEDLPELALRIRRDGEGVRVYIADQFFGWFKTMEEALDAGLRQALRGADLSGVAPEIEAALAAPAESLEQLMERLAGVQEVLDWDLDPLQIEIRNTLRELDSAREMFGELGLATDRFVGHEITAWQQWRDTVTGRQRTHEEELEIQRGRARLWNAEKALRLAQVEADIAALDAEKGLVRGQVDLDLLRIDMQQATLDAQREGLRAQGEIWAAEERTSIAHQQNMAAIVGASATVANAQRQALIDLRDALAAIPDIDMSEIRLPGSGRGGRRRSDRERLAGILDDFDLGQLGEVEQAFARLNERWDEHAELAHGNAELLERVAAAREAESEALAESLRSDVFARIEAMEPLGEVERQLIALTRERTEIEEQLEALYAAGVISAEELASALDRVTAATAAQRDEMQSRLSGEADSLMIGLLEAAGRTEEAAELRWRLDLEGYRLRINQLEAEYQLLNATARTAEGLIIAFQPLFESGDAFAAAIQRMRELLGEIQAAGPPTAGAGTGGGVGGSAVSGVSQIQRERESAQESIEDILRSVMPPYERELLELTEQFDEYRRVLGNTAEVQQAWNIAFGELNERYTESIRDYLETLRDPLLSPSETYETVLGRFMELAASGDLSQQGELIQLANQLQDLYLQTYGSAAGQGGGFAALLDLIEQQMQAFLAAGGIPQNQIPSAPVAGGGPGPLGIVPQGYSPSQTASAIASSVTAPGVEVRLDQIRAAIEQGNQSQHQDFVAQRQDSQQQSRRLQSEIRRQSRGRVGLGQAS